MFSKNNFSIEACRAYGTSKIILYAYIVFDMSHHMCCVNELCPVELRCYDSFGYEFIYSHMMATVIRHFPICLDAMAVVGQRRGQKFLDFFGEVSVFCLI
jgi:hypothetical protein